MKHSVVFTAPCALLLVGCAAPLERAVAQEPVWDGNTVVLESRELADGVFAVLPENAETMAAEGAPIATTSGFVIGADGARDAIEADFEPYPEARP